MAGIEFNQIIKSMSGRMGNVVFYTRNGRCFARTYVKPNDPCTKKQAGRRDSFARLVTGWRETDETERDEWRQRARRKNMSGYNLYISEGMKEWDSKREREPLIQEAREQHVPLRRVMRRERFQFCLRHTGMAVEEETCFRQRKIPALVKSDCKRPLPQSLSDTWMCRELARVAAGRRREVFTAFRTEAPGEPHTRAAGKVSNRERQPPAGAAFPPFWPDKRGCPAHSGAPAQRGFHASFPKEVQPSLPGRRRSDEDQY